MKSLRRVALLCGRAGDGWDADVLQTAISRLGLEASLVCEAPSNSTVPYWRHVCEDNSIDGVIVGGSNVQVNMVRRALTSRKAVLCTDLVSLQPAAITACYEHAHNYHTTFMMASTQGYAVSRGLWLQERLRRTLEKVRRSNSRCWLSWSSTHTTQGEVYQTCVSKDIGAICWLTGEVPEMIKSDVYTDSQCKQRVVSNLYYPTCRVTIETNQLHRRGRILEEEVEEYGEKRQTGGRGAGMLSYTLSPHYRAHIEASTSLSLRRPPEEPDTARHSLYLQLQHFHDTHLRDLPYREGEADETLRMAHVTSAARESAHTGRDVTLSSCHSLQHVQQSLWPEGHAARGATVNL